LLAALFAAGVTWWVSWRMAHARRSPAARMSIYLETPRVHLGGRPAQPSGTPVGAEVLRRVLGPLAGGVISFLSRMVLTGPDDVLEVSLRQAGMNMTPAVYRRQYLRWMIFTPLALGTLGALAGRASYVVVFFIAGIFAGSRRMPERVKAAIKRRRERMRSDLPTVVSVLALKIENNKSLVVAVSDVVTQGSGPVVEELGRAVHLINAGYGEAASFELIARETPEPAAARFYRFLSAATSGGIDIVRALLDQACELRVERREEVERSAARRQMSLVVPNLAFMAPVLFAFLLAPLPSLLFGK
jgi:Type II secretion system (T2SS), protein F